MPSIDYTWATGAPPEPNVYMTRLGESRTTTIRWWDGDRWWGIEAPRDGRMPKKVFVWPKPARLPMSWYHRGYADRLALRKLSAQERVQWGTPFKVFSQVEVLRWMVQQGVLPADWKAKYQGEMQG